MRRQDCSITASPDQGLGARPERPGGLLVRKVLPTSAPFAEETREGSTNRRLANNNGYLSDTYQGLLHLRRAYTE
eukprot:551258-Prorocentrum_minimum.AAC.1